MRATKRPNVDESTELDVTRAKVVRRGPKSPLGPRFDLRSMREAVGKTQDDIARAADMDQGDVSRLEQRGDVKVSTLRRYVRALGAELELVVVLKTGHKMRLDV
jgi:predicted transcriptional regulator